VLIPILYLKGISTGDFEETLAALLGKDAPGLSASTIARLKEVWRDEHVHWRKRDLSAKRYVYVWADGIYLAARLEDAKQCILVIIGATPEGRKELLGFADGARESASGREALRINSLSGESPTSRPPAVQSQCPALLGSHERLPLSDATVGCRDGASRLHQRRAAPARASEKGM
jgi:hypothetical protein